MCDIYFLNRATNCIFFVIHVWIFLELCINFRGNTPYSQMADTREKTGA